jgi:glyoxylase-like metal-dependent hydrolase (beta-lactamase superfamily II)
MLTRDVAPGIHRVEDAYTNWYLVEDDGRITVVDCGVPTSWGSFQSALGELGLAPGAVDAVVLTHAHFDHIGFAERARSELGVPVFCHENDAPLARHPQQYAHERSRLRYIAGKPQALPVIWSFARNRAFFPKPVQRVERYGNEGSLAVPGSPRIVFTPGHTLGHCSLHFPDRDTLIAGDAVVTFNPYLAASGPQIVAGAATADYDRNLRSLDTIAETGATTVLCGHGDPWREGAVAIAERARAVGPT